MTEEDSSAASTTVKIETLFDDDKKLTTQRKSKKDLNFNMTLSDYEEKFGRIMGQKNVQGVAVISRDGEVTYYNDGITDRMLQAFSKAMLDTEYLCNLMARTNDPMSKLQYIRIETNTYEMVINLESTHLAFMLCSPTELDEEEEE